MKKMRKYKKKRLKYIISEGCDFIYKKQSRIGAKSLWSGFVYILLFSNFVFGYKLKTLKLF